MVNNESQALDQVFHALSDPTRREILKRLATREFTITELADPFKMSLAAVSKHIKVLEEAGLLTRTRDGRIHRCAMNGEPLKQASELIQYYRRFWEGRFRALDDYLKMSLNSEMNPEPTQVKGEKNVSRKK